MLRAGSAAGDRLENEHVDLMRRDADGRLVPQRAQRPGLGPAQPIEEVQVFEPQGEVHVLATARPARAGTVRSAALPSTELAPRSRSVRPRSPPDAPARPPSPPRRRGATRDSDEGARDSAARCRARKAGDPLRRGSRPCACTTLQTLGRLEFPELDSDACDGLDHDRAGRSCFGLLWPASQGNDATQSCNPRDAACSMSSTGSIIYILSRRENATESRWAP